MKASLPVITTSEGALPDMVEDQVTGFIIQKGSPEQLANKLKLLLADENLRLKIGQAGYEKYLKKYTSTIMQQRMSDVLSGVLDKCNN
jgi:glycosyltransferase involved in cell wall biosynthesis